MLRYDRRRIRYVVGALASAILLCALLSWFYSAKAQTVNTPIPRHNVMKSASDYCYYPWFADADSVAGRWWSYSIPCWPWQDSWWYTSAYNVNIQIGVAYKWGGGDYINNQLTPCNNNEHFGQRIADTNDLAGDVNNNWYCGDSWKPTYPGARGVDCSGFVTRVWGRPTCDKWGTEWGIPQNSTAIPFGSADEARRRMRMGDVFNDPDNHVVLLHYYDPENYHQPIYYEASWGEAQVIHNDDDGWGGIAGAARRYGHIRDDAYLPYLAYNWSGWFSTAFVHNNYPSYFFHVAQHTLYNSGGGDTAAHDSRTWAVIAEHGNDTWPISSNFATSGYSGGGVVAGDTGTSTIVDVLGNNQAMMYTGVSPFSSLGRKTATTLYFPNYLNNYWSGYSAAHVQNAGSANTWVTATYYETDGTPVCSLSRPVAPWGRTIFYAEDDCQGHSLGGLRLTSSGGQPLAAVAEECVGGQCDQATSRRGAYNAFSSGYATLYAPVLLRNFYGWVSGIHLHNVTSTATTVYVYYYRSNGTEICHDSVYLPGNGFAEIYQGGSGTCLAGYGEQIYAARLSAGQAFVALVNKDHPGGGDFQVYGPLPGNVNTLVFPYVRRDAYWNTDMVVQNASPYVNDVTVTFYNMDGQLNGAVHHDISANGWWQLASQVPANFTGSAVVRGNHPIAAVADLFDSLMSQDGALCYEGVEEKTNFILGLPEELEEVLP